MNALTPLKIDTAEIFPYLPNAPIVEAVIQFHLTPQENWKQEDVVPMVKPQLTQYSKLLSQQAFQQQIKVLGGGKGVEAPPQSAVWHGIRAESDDGRYVAQIIREGLVVSRMRPYENWESFWEETYRLWKLRCELGEIKQIERLGLRFINRIELPPGEMSFEHYIQNYPKPPQGLPVPFFNFFHQDTLAVPGFSYVIKLTRTVQPPQKPGMGMGLILDIDVMTSGEPLQLRRETIEQALQQMRWLKNKVFFGSVSEKAIQSFK